MIGHGGLKLFHDRLHPLPVDSEIRVTDARRRAKVNRALLTVDEELDVVDEAKQSAREFRVKIMLISGDDLTSRHR